MVIDCVVKKINFDKENKNSNNILQKISTFDFLRTGYAVFNKVYIPMLSNDIKIAVQKNNLGGQIWYRTLSPVNKRRQ